ncbi:hypothetical protein JGK52_12240 [Cytobacillus oceanisediminis]|uniref:hypothetical protein n=1 Tax=Cytobacillus oceanisediminis TaxID=665099 RepID=UPI001D13709C|nr:hypothetical protein [Cytobacillus oceanisediminis]MCC3647427.1 hypothetical protein [Cytobacillus oceanisediminis]
MLDTSTIKNEASKGFYKFVKQNPKVGHFLEQIQEYGELIVLGGALRDFSFNQIPRDIDIMVNTVETDFDDIMNMYDYRKNRFGGYNVLIDNIELDVWSIKDNWAFKNRYYDASFKNVTKGAFFNIDAIALNLDTGDIDADKFSETLKNRMLDINLDLSYIDSNPNPEKNVVRAFRLRKKWKLEFSKSVQSYCQRWFDNNENSFEIIFNVEKKHYGDNLLKESDFDLLYS